MKTRLTTANQLARASALIRSVADDILQSSEPAETAMALRRRQHATVVVNVEWAGIALLALDRRPVALNTVWRELFGHDADKHDCGRAPESVIAFVDEVTHADTTTFVNDVLIEASNTTLFATFAITPVRAANEQLIAISIACVDTTEHVIERRLAAAAGNLMWMGTTTGELQQANAAWLAYTGCVDAISWRDPIHVDDRERCAEAFQRAIHDRLLIVTTLRLRQATGVYRWHTARVLATSATVCAAVAADINSCRDGQIEVALGLEDWFLARVSHELRAPLATMLLWDNVLRDEHAAEELRRQARDAIHESAMTQARLVGDLLDVTRASRGKLSLDLHPRDMNSLVCEVIDSLTPALQAKRVAIDVALGSALIVVEADAVRMRQVVENLLSNALKFTDAGGRVRVELLQREDTVDLVVTDTGRGVRADFLPHIFEPFTQADDGVARQGLGLGLAIARELVLLHRGRITATSAGVGLGTTFVVTLPAVAVNTLPCRPPPPAGTRLDGVHVLLVDDDQRVLAALALLLRRSGADVGSVDSAEGARDALSTKPFDVLVCDIGMPREDGYSFLRRLRQERNATPAIALTAYATSIDVCRARDAGFNAHLAKPIDFERLVTAIRSAIEGNVTERR